MSTLAPEPQQVFQQLYDRYARDVYRYSLAVLRNPADAEDVTQTTFMNAYRAIVRGERPENPHHWLIVIAHNACRTRAIRAARRPREVPLDETVRDVPVPESERPNLRAVLEALGRLPFNQRSALVMRELEGRSYEEIAEMLGVTVAAVETLIFRARRSLRLRKDALRGLGLVQLPASLQAFGTTAVAGSGAVLGGGVALKAAAALVAAVIAGGATVEAVTGGKHARRRVTAVNTPILIASVLDASRAVRAAADVTLRHGTAAHVPAAATRPGAAGDGAAIPGGTPTLGETKAAEPAASGSSSGSIAGATTVGGTVPVPVTTTSIVSLATPTVPLSVPQLPAPPPPATLPSAPAPVPALLTVPTTIP